MVDERLGSVYNVKPISGARGSRSDDLFDALQHRGQLRVSVHTHARATYTHTETGCHSSTPNNTPSSDGLLARGDTSERPVNPSRDTKTYTHAHTHAHIRTGCSPPAPPAPLCPLPRHPHPGASDPHASPCRGSVQRLHVLASPGSRRWSAGHHRAHHPGGSRLPGLPAALHARFVPHLGLG